MQEKRYQVRRYLVVAATLAASLALLIRQPLPADSLNAGWLVSLLALCLSAFYLETRTISLGPAGTFSPAPMLMYVVALVHGPWAVLPITLLLLPTWKGCSSKLFNSAQHLLHAACAGLVFQHVVGLRPESLWYLLLAHLLAIAAYVSVNLTLVTLIKTASGQGAAAVLWHSYYAPILPIYVDSMLYGAICVIVFSAIGWAGAVFTIFLAYSKLTVQVNVVGGLIGKALSAESLIKAIDARDSYTKDHSDRVARCAQAIAQQLRLSPAAISDITVASKLHDIGKIAIPDSILLKAGSLTDEEFRLIQQHPIKSQQILEVNSQLARIAEIVGQHHERYDGKGYPAGLKGGVICLEARIIACADAFDAMTTNRPYRQALTVPEAVEELRANRGTQFDPEVVNALFRSLGAAAETVAGVAGSVRFPGQINASLARLPAAPSGDRPEVGANSL